MHSLLSAFDQSERLVNAVHTGNYEEALACLMEGAKATVATSCGRTAVGTAALVGDAEILELLIQSCEEPDLDIFRKHCANSNDLELDTTPDGMDNLEWEDEFNCDCDDIDGPIADDMQEHISLYFYYAKTFERTGAIINSMDTYAADCNYVTLQDPHTMDALFMTPLHYAAACGHLECVQILLKHAAPIDVVNNDGYTPLHLSAEHCEVVRLLLKNRANPNMKTLNTGETVLHLAIRNRCTTATANTILETKFNINATDDMDQTPLMCAIINDLDDIAVVLIEKGARINLQDKEGRNALYYAVRNNNVVIASLLLDRGARRLISHYLLHHCVQYNLRSMAELLIKHGDNLNVRNKEGLTPILLAILSLKVDMLEYLLKVEAIHIQQGKFVDRVENELIIAVQYINNLNDFKPIARILFAYSDGSWMLPITSITTTSSTTCYTPYCQTPLARAIMLNKLDIAEFLIKEGADISQICRDHVVNSLRSMVPNGFLELAKLLVHAGFKFPYCKLPFPKTWKPERQKFEEKMRELSIKPLALQSQARIVLRRHLLNNLISSKGVRWKKYQATKHESSISRMINELEIPILLKEFLIEFNDCPTVMHSKFQSMHNRAHSLEVSDDN